jgi:asparagine synthase (glutamine-hydrolysing)
MCGIAGEIRFRAVNSESADWDKISEMMSRRGPDDSGIWSDNKYCTFVFRRLAIIDLSPRGHQPMTAHNNRYALIFNGEVYNFMNLRKQLESRGVRFYSNSDSEVVLHALVEWGNEALEKFNGMFALGFYDSHEKRLLLARDHAGIKPLYYLSCPNGVAFSSQYDQLLSHPWSRKLEVSDEALGLYLRLAYIPAPYALLKNSHMLEPGTWVEIHMDGSIKKGTYFTFPYQYTPSLKGKEALDAVDEAVTAAVKRQLVSDVPVGAFLSGGIDSPLVVSKMRAVSTNSIHTFTIATGEEATDESLDAMMYAQEIGVEQFIDQISPEQALTLIDDVIDACGEPFGDYSMFPTLAVSRLASSMCKVVLSGDGGDELFWGYPGRFGRLIKMTNHFRVPYWLRKLRWRLRRAISLGNRRRYLPIKSLGDYHRSMLTHLKEPLLKEIFPTLPAWPSEYAAFAYAGWKPDRIAQWSRWNEFVYHLTMVFIIHSRFVFLCLTAK